YSVLLKKQYYCRAPQLKPPFLFPFFKFQLFHVDNFPNQQRPHFHLNCFTKILSKKNRIFPEVFTINFMPFFRNSPYGMKLPIYMFSSHQPAVVKITIAMAVINGKAEHQASSVFKFSCQFSVP